MNRELSLMAARGAMAIVLGDQHVNGVLLASQIEFN
jgi:hypothetical protein